MPVSKDLFRNALSHFASGVTVVTARTEDGQKKGITVSAFTSLSLEPPLVLICIDKKASIHQHLAKDGWFAVNMLSCEQEHLSRRFASRDEMDRFTGLDCTEGRSGCPLIAGALTSIECRIIDAYPGGDHTIFVGEVDSVDSSGGSPLLYFRGSYAKLGSE